MEYFSDMDNLAALLQGADIPPHLLKLHSETNKIPFVGPCRLPKILGQKGKSNHLCDSASHQNFTVRIQPGQELIKPPSDDKNGLIFSMCNGVTDRPPLQIRTSFSFRTDSSVIGRGWLVEAIVQNRKHFN